MSDVNMTSLFEAGAHFGHKTSRWHPKMAQYIHSSKNGVHIINLEKTVELIQISADFAEKTVGEGKQILLIGTKRQTQEMIEAAAVESKMPYVSYRWFGGMLTNYKTMQQRIKRLIDLETKMASGELAGRFSKLEVQRFQEEIDQLNHDFGGIKEMKGLPGALFVADVVTDHNAVKEAAKLGIPVIGIVDTNADPSKVDYPIPANDDAIKCLNIITNVIVEAISRGKTKVKLKEVAVEDEAKKQ